MPRIGSEEDYKNSGNDSFGKLPEEEYVFEIVGYRQKDGKVHPQYNPNGDPRIELNCRPVSLADDEDEDVLDEDGNPIHPDKYVNFFVNGSLQNPKGLGFGPAGASRARRLIWGAMSTKVSEPLNFEWDDLVGKRFIGSVVIGDNGYEKIETVRPYKNKRAGREQRPTRAPAAIDAARQVFKDDLDEDLPF